MQGENGTRFAESMKRDLPQVVVPPTFPDFTTRCLPGPGMLVQLRPCVLMSCHLRTCVVAGARPAILRQLVHMWMFVPVLEPSVRLSR